MPYINYFLKYFYTDDMDTWERLIHLQVFYVILLYYDRLG